MHIIKISTVLCDYKETLYTPSVTTIWTKLITYIDYKDDICQKISKTFFSEFCPSKPKPQHIKILIIDAFYEIFKIKNFYSLTKN